MGEVNIDHLTRQLEILDINKLGQKIDVIGAGAIGSWTTLCLAKMGFCNIRVWDFDDVSVENMNSQFFRFCDIGKPKVIALKELVKDFTNIDIEIYNEKWEGQKLNGIVIAAVDSMSVRQNISLHCQDNFLVSFIIDPRMSAEKALLFVVNNSDDKSKKDYSGSLYTDADAVQERCTAKATCYTASLISGLVLKSVKDIVMNKAYTRNVIYNIAENAMQAWNIGKKEMN